MADSAKRPGSLRLAVAQMACGVERENNLAVAERLVRQAAASGAGVVLLPELFASPYFCKDMDPAHFQLAEPARTSTLLERMAALAAELDVVLPVSFFELDEKCGKPHYYNSVAIYDGSRRLGQYRKSHIPEGPGYREKFYFTPGETGFKVWNTSKGRIGVGICWDQWFPEAARIMALMGAELLLFPTAIGSEPDEPELHTRPHWQKVMQGHAGANLCFLAAANRVGKEAGTSCEIRFYGGSFVAGPYAEVLAEADEESETLLLADLELGIVDGLRRSWGFCRDRRPDLYDLLLDPVLDSYPSL